MRTSTVRTSKDRRQISRSWQAMLTFYPCGWSPLVKCASLKRSDWTEPKEAKPKDVRRIRFSGPCIFGVQREIAPTLQRLLKEHAGRIMKKMSKLPYDVRGIHSVPSRRFEEGSLQ